MSMKLAEAEDLTLSLGDQRKNKKQSPTVMSLSPRAGLEVSTKLTLSDETLPTENMKDCIKELSEADMKGRAVACKIATMKNYKPGEKEEEQKGVSTKLEIYLDPRITNKKLTRSDLNHVYRLMLNISLVEKRVLAFMDVDIVNKIADDDLLVIVCDQDIDSVIS